MKRYAAGDVAAFERLYARHEGAVYRFLLRSVGIAAIADELLQDVWMSVIRSADGYEARALFSTWLYRIARTRLIDHWRARDPAVLVSLDAAARDDGDSHWAGALAADRSVEPEVRALDRAQARAFTCAVEALPAAQREAFLLHVQADLTLAQVSAVTGVGVETIKSRLRYASDKLRGAMQEWRNDR
ncbi:RNA polymerase sigma factor, sigma-70 family [Burkholderiales bacterium]|nr:RNA polymerase sigma factor, sigma-70 family [Burkholderiales bacterium]